MAKGAKGVGFWRACKRSKAAFLVAAMAGQVLGMAQWWGKNLMVFVMGSAHVLGT